MLIRHKINGVLAVVDDEYAEELLASGYFVKPRKRNTPTEDAPQAEAVEAWLEAEKAWLAEQD